MSLPSLNKVITYLLTDPTICRPECRISDVWVLGYLNLLSNLLCGGGATMLYFFRPLLLDYIKEVTEPSEQLKRTVLHCVHYNALTTCSCFL